MELKHPTRVILISLVSGWCFDFLFWQKSGVGISFFIFVALNLAAGLLLVRFEGNRPSPRSLVLLLPCLFFAAVTFFREEPFTLFVSILLTLGSMMLMAATLRSGLWLKYSLMDIISNFFFLGIASLAGGSTLISQATKKRPAEEGGAPVRTTIRSQVLPALRGLLLAFPIVVVMALLLASADPIFSEQLNQIFNLDRWVEYVARGIYIVILAYMLSGVFLHMLSKSQEQRLIGIDKPWLSPFLGWTEAAIILGSVDLLFIFFVGVQFRYFFGGQANIHIQGYTYAEYARRGFSELVFVAILSLLLFLGLSAVSRRQTGFQRRSFSGLGIGLVTLVAVILVSAYQRLLLYETAYGFSRIRTYTHVFMIWLGVLLVATVVLELLGRERAFGLAAILCAFGFGASLSLLNVDGFIAARNVARAEQGSSLDMPYLVSLSDDAVPTLVNLFNTSTNSKVKDQVGGALACTAALMEDRHVPIDTLSFHLSTDQARSLLAAQAGALAAYPTHQDSNLGMMVKIKGENHSCSSYSGMD